MFIAAKDSGGRFSSVAFASGVIAGLVAITPAAGYVDPISAMVIGAIAGIFSYYMVNFRVKKGWDETLDAWAVHGMSGLWGSIAIGIFSNPVVAGKAGLLFGNPWQLVPQIVGSAASIVYAMVVTYIIAKFVDAVIGWRVPEQAEKIGLDLPELNEEAYVL
jgi:Amt family ammonium transporter